MEICTFSLPLMLVHLHVLLGSCLAVFIFLFRLQNSLEQSLRPSVTRRGRSCHQPKHVFLVFHPLYFHAVWSWWLSCPSLKMTTLSLLSSKMSVCNVSRIRMLRVSSSWRRLSLNQMLDSWFPSRSTCYSLCNTFCPILSLDHRCKLSLCHSFNDCNTVLSLDWQEDSFGLRDLPLSTTIVRKDFSELLPIICWTVCRVVLVGRWTSYTQGILIGRCQNLLNWGSLWSCQIFVSVCDSRGSGRQIIHSCSGSCSFSPCLSSTQIIIKVITNIIC